MWTVIWMPVDTVSMWSYCGYWLDNEEFEVYFSFFFFLRNDGNVNSKWQLNRCEVKKKIQNFKVFLFLFAAHTHLAVAIRAREHSSQSRNGTDTFNCDLADFYANEISD